MTIEETIIGVLRHYRQTEVCDEDGYGYPLVDALTLQGHSIDMGIREIESIADTIADALRREREPVKVKPLVWDVTGWQSGDGIKGENDDAWCALALGFRHCAYGIDWYGGADFRLTDPDDNRTSHPSLAAAKAAAQADYEARILAALEPDQTALATPAPDAVQEAARTRLLEKALKVAMGYLAPQQPGDSRAVDDWFVACAAVQCELDDTDGRIEQCLDAALLTQEQRK